MEETEVDESYVAGGGLRSGAADRVPAGVAGGSATALHRGGCGGRCGPGGLGAGAGAAVRVGGGGGGGVEAHAL